MICNTFRLQESSTDDDDLSNFPSSSADCPGNLADSGITMLQENNHAVVVTPVVNLTERPGDFGRNTDTMENTILAASELISLSRGGLPNVVYVDKYSLLTILRASIRLENF